MSPSIKQVSVVLLLAAQVAAVLLLNRDESPAADLGETEALNRYGFYLRSCARECGIDFVHEGPRQLDEKLAHILPIIASMGASVSVVDFDKDGWLDLYVTTSREEAKNRLYRNNGNGTFTDVAEKLGIAEVNRTGTGVCQGAVWGDFDNDGFEDLLIYKWGKPELFMNRRGQSFEPVGDQVGLPKWVNANSAIWVDYDCDGHLDLLIAGYWPDDIDLWNLKSTWMMPESFEYAKNGGRKYLLRNRGDGRFEDVTEKMGIRSTRWTLGLSAADLCGSGYPDIIFANDYGVSEFFCNKQGRKFEEIGALTRIGETPKSGMGASFGDIANTGQLSIYITNITEPGNLVQGNNLWVPDAHEPGKPARYVNQAGKRKVERGGWSWGAQFGDLNNDGRLDLYLTNGNISGNPKKESFWYKYGLIAGGNKHIIGDAAKWPAIEDRSLSGFQTKRVYWNQGSEFVDIAAGVGVTDQYDGRAVVMADLFNRGVLDVVVANQNGPLLLYKNSVAPGQDWVQVELTGSAGNRSAIGALVRIFWKMSDSDRLQEQVQVVSGGNGYAAQNMRRLHFGLGRDAEIEKIVIQWPSPAGKTQTIEAPNKNKLHVIEESKP